jgi:hypothetical protein
MSELCVPSGGDWLSRDIETAFSGPPNQIKTSVTTSTPSGRSRVFAPGSRLLHVISMSTMRSRDSRHRPTYVEVVPGVSKILDIE